MTRLAFIPVAALIGASAALLPAAIPAEAKGCIKGAVVGGVAGHYAGHHAVLGAIGGCVAGRHIAKSAERKKLEQDAAPGVPPTPQPQPNQPAQ